MKKQSINLMALILIGIIMMSFPSCSTGHLHKTGDYTVSSRNGDEVTFAGVKGSYVIPGNNITPGARIKLTRVQRGSAKVNMSLVNK